MIKVDEAFQVRYKKGKETFEVLVDFEKLGEFRKKSEEVSVYDVLADVKIFKDQRKGEIASDVALKNEFGNVDEENVLKEILIKGECQIPTSYLNNLRNEKKVQVVNFIVENSINAQSKSKFTPTMIEAEVNKLKYNFDAFKDVSIQSEEVAKLLKKVLPISMEKIILQITIPGMHCGAFYGSFRKMGKLLKEYFDREGNLVMDFQIAESQLDVVTNYIKSNSQGEGSYFKKEN